MHRKLIVKAFEKAKDEMEKSGISNPVPTKLAKYLSDRIDEEVDFIYGDRSLRNYYRKILNEKEADIYISQIDAVIGLCKFLGYNDYQDFISKEESGNVKHEPEKEDGIKKVNSADKKFNDFVFRNYKKILIILFSMLIFVFYYFNVMVDNEEWMVWENDKYVEKQFDEASYTDGNLKILDEKLLLSFRKIKPNCSTEFFKSNGIAQIWYGKSSVKEYEFFTSFGFHPETGNPLKPITEYMIKKYICDTLK